MGALARDGLHPELAGDLPVGVFCDAAWSAWVDILLRIDGPERLDALTQTWDDLNAPAPGSAAAAGPTMADWGTSEQAQAAQHGLMAMFGPAAPAGGEG